MNEKTIKNTPADMDLGKGRKAWKMDVAAAKAGVENGQQDRTVAAWVVEAPDVHPIFPHAVVVLLQLHTDGPGLDKAVKHLEGATHEIMVANLNPEVEIGLDRANSVLDPFNYVGQFIAADDANAIARLDFTVGEIVEGKLSPDSDAVEDWALRFGRWSMKGGSSVGPAGARQINGILGLLEALGMGVRDPETPKDEWGATVGCTCPGCQAQRIHHGGPALPPVNHHEAPKVVQ